ncbi:MAG TPA: hypothetical protein VNM92_02585 [Thermoanaerobaculia bacterium]|nr:hypothetical protein [Thermoanaerobaculia bacterium]
MRRILIGMTAVALTFSTWQASAASGVASGKREAERVAGASWISRARLSSAALSPAPDDVHLGEASATRPIALVETNYYTFLPGEPVQVRMTINPNGYTAPATIFLYNENRVTGERRYQNIAGGSLAAGTTADLFGSVGTPVPIVVPALNDFVLFGASTDPVLRGFGVNGVLGGSLPAPTGQTGLHQWVLEIRDAAGRRVISRSTAMYSYINESVPVSGTITSSTTWTASKRYVLSDFVGVAEPAVLTIEPGTVIYGGDTKATLFVLRGAKIIADGTLRRPIIFTSPQRVGSRAQRDWGSLVLLGRAPINETGGQGILEGLAGQSQYSFGGTNAADSSGVLRYVRLEFGGFPIVTDQEINGLTLAAVGNGTVIDYIEVLHNKDDAFEFFGGTVNAKHLLAVAYADDGLDFDLGYQGTIQYVALIKRAANDENDGNIVSESDGHPQNFTLTPLTNPRVYNVTGYGTGSTTLGNYGNVLRRGTAGKFFNLIVTGSKNAPVTIRDDATFNNTTSGELNITNSILHGDFSDAKFPNRDDRGQRTRDFVFATAKGNRNVDPLLAAGAPSLLRTLMPDLTPLPDSPALDSNFVAVTPDNGFLEQVDFIGAIAPGNNWVLSGWANFSDN